MFLSPCHVPLVIAYYHPPRSLLGHKYPQKPPSQSDIPEGGEYDIASQGLSTIKCALDMT